MKRCNTTLTIFGSLLLASSAYAAGPGFDGIDVNSGTTGTLSGCPAGTSTCTTLIEGEGFLQQEVADNPVTYVQTVVIDPLATNTQDDVVVAWLGQRVGRFTRQIASTVTVTATGPITTIDPSTFGIPAVVLATIESTNPASTEPSNSIWEFKPGKHLFTWQAPAPFDSEAPQWTHVLNILPLVSFGPATTIIASEGSQVTIPVYLNGNAPSYPVKIPYTINGSASLQDDHDAIDGEVTINSGTMGTITFNVANDEINNESLEEIIFTLQQPATVNTVLGQHTTKRVLISDTHLPPQLDITVTQSNDSTRFIDNYTESNDLLNTAVTIIIHANNPASRYLIDWSETDNTILAATTATVDKTLYFNPVGIPAGIYKIKAQITDLLAADGVKYTIDTLININDITAPALTEADEPTQYTHTFENGISLRWPALPIPSTFGFESIIDNSDSATSTFSTTSPEVTAPPFAWNTIDFGTPPSLDFINMPAVGEDNFLSPFESITTSTTPLAHTLPDAPVTTGDTPHVTPGLNLRSGGIIIASGKSGNNITLDDLRNHGGPNGGPALYPVDYDQIPTQIVDFEIAGLTTPGQSASIVIPQDNPIPENPVYRKYMPQAGWVTFTEDDNNSLASTRKVEGVCPAAEATAYVAGLTAGDDCVRLTIEDGGPNDADQQANTIIKDPGGVSAALPAETTIAASNNTATTNTNSGGGGGSGLNLLWLLLAGCIVRGIRGVNR